MLAVKYIITESKTNKNNQENFNYYMAATLSLLAQSIRVNTQLKNPYEEEGQIQDIL